MKRSVNSVEERLARYGLVVYDLPQAHVPMEDIKLALSREQYITVMLQTMQFVRDDRGRCIGVHPQSLLNVLELNVRRGYDLTT